MPIQRYGVLKARPIAGRQGRGRTPHFHIHAVDSAEDYRIAVNVKSRSWPSELLYLLDDRFDHPILEGLRELPLGFRGLQPKPGGQALDFVRGNLFERRHMRALAHDVPGPDNDLNELLDLWVGRALRDEGALLYVFGERFGPEHDPDPHFGFRPATGMHRVHMNQGSRDCWSRDDGPWQDGGLLLWFPPVHRGDNVVLRERWVALFLAFQSQAWHTDDGSGRALSGHAPEPGASSEGEDQPRGGHGRVRLVGAVINPAGHDPGREQVTIHNIGRSRIDLRGWSIRDINKHADTLSGSLSAGATTTVTLTGEGAQLSNDGGLISIVDPDGIKVDGVSYTRAQTRRGGGRLVF